MIFNNIFILYIYIYIYFFFFLLNKNIKLLKYILNIKFNIYYLYLY